MNKAKLFLSPKLWGNSFSLAKAIRDLFSAVGVIWMLVEVLSFFSDKANISLKSDWLILLVLVLAWTIIQNWPKTSYRFQLRGKDISIVISIGELFSYDGDMVIPVNTSFDTSFEGDLISKNSVQGQFTQLFFTEASMLEEAIKVQLASSPPMTQLPNKTKGNKFRYEIGKVIKLKLARWNKFAYLVASSDMNDEGTAFSDLDKISTSLGALWEFVRTKGECDKINIPIIGSGRGRVSQSREELIKAIVFSFVASASTSSRFCNKLNIVIHPYDFKEYNINLKELTDFIRLKTIHY